MLTGTYTKAIIVVQEPFDYGQIAEYTFLCSKSIMYNYIMIVQANSFFFMLIIITGSSFLRAKYYLKNKL